jgi:hypothetical protein
MNGVFVKLLCNLSLPTKCCFCCIFGNAELFGRLDRVRQDLIKNLSARDVPDRV